MKRAPNRINLCVHVDAAAAFSLGAATHAYQSIYFVRPKIRDMHINKANSLVFPNHYAAPSLSLFLFVSLVLALRFAISVWRALFLRSPPLLTWHKLIRWIDIFLLLVSSYFRRGVSVFVFVCTCHEYLLHAKCILFSQKRRLLYAVCVCAHAAGVRASTNKANASDRHPSASYYVQHINIYEE